MGVTGAFPGTHAQSPGAFRAVRWDVAPGLVVRVPNLRLSCGAPEAVGGGTDTDSAGKSSSALA